MDGPLTLAQTAALLDGHARAENELFRVLGFWSTNPPSDDPAAAVQAVLAAESAHHGWRAEQWEIRRVRSVDPDPEPDLVSDADRLVAAVAAAVGEEIDSASRLAVWGHLWAPFLAARYARHRLSVSPAADEGVLRWLDMCISDLQRGATAAVLGLGDLRPGDRARVAETLAGAARRLVA